jgi:hypothetical protein
MSTLAPFKSTLGESFHVEFGGRQACVKKLLVLLSSLRLKSSTKRELRIDDDDFVTATRATRENASENMVVELLVRSL